MGDDSTFRKCLRGTLRTLPVMIFLTAMAWAAPVITVASPVAGSTTGSPVQVTAKATSSAGVSLMQVYVDGVKKYEVKAASVNTTVSLAAGAHKLTVTATDGTIVKSYVNFTVGSSSTSTTTSTSGIPSNALVTSNVDEKTGWSSCDVCAGPGGAGATV